MLPTSPPRSSSSSRRSPIPLADRELADGHDPSAAVLRDIALVATDVDGTLTRAGALDPRVVAVIPQLAAAGVEVVPVSGRPAGEVLGLCRYLPGVRRGLAENGLLEVVPDRAPRWLDAPTDLARLVAAGERLAREHDVALQRTGDAFCRLGDVAYERDGMAVDALVTLRDAAEAMGVFLVWSNVHIHIAERLPDKGASVLQLAREDGLAPRRVVTIGDAPNDAGLFVAGRFGLTVGTADVIDQRDVFPSLPDCVTRGRESDGFLELAALLLRTRAA